MGDKDSETTFEVGAAIVRPARRELVCGSETLRLEPKVMAVLDLLARADGAPVSRARLVDEIWGGRAVSDDAVTRCTSALRKIFRDRPELGVEIETIPKTGYALLVSPASAQSDALRSPSAPRGSLRRGAPAAFAAGGFVASMVLVIAIAVGAQTGAPEPPASPRPVTTTLGFEVDPALSPSGGRVAFSWGGPNNENWDVYVKSVGSEARLRLTDDAARDYRPAWSPDGARIAFARSGADGGCGVYAAPSVGGPARRLSDCGAATAQSIDWSPDGSRLAVTARDDSISPGRLYFVDVEAGTRLAADDIHRRFAPGVSIEDARFGPRGRLAFSANPALGVEDAYVYDFAARSLVRVSRDETKLHGLDWSADGRSLFLASNRGGAFALWRARIEGGAPTLVLGAAADSPSVSGERLVYESWRQESDIRRLDLASGARVGTPLYSSTRYDWDVQVSPDGARVAFLSDRSGAAELWVASRDGSGLQKLTDLNGPYIHSPRWSPDGRAIAFAAPLGGQFDVFSISSEGGQPVRLTHADGDDFAPSWAPDGGAIYFGSNRGGAWSIWRYDIASRRAAPVEGAAGKAPQASPDGGALYYVKAGEPGIWRYDLTASIPVEEKLLDDPHPVDWANWRVTERAIYYVRRENEGAPDLMRYDLRGGVQSVAATLPDFYHKSGLWISPDEADALYATIRTENVDLYMIEIGERAS